MDQYQEIGSDDPRFTRLTEQVEKRGLKLGLYFDGLTVHPTNVPDRLMVVANFRTGELAFKERRLDEAVAKEDDTFREIEDTFLNQQVEEIRRNLAKGTPFGEPEEGK